MITLLLVSNMCEAIPAHKTSITEILKQKASNFATKVQHATASTRTSTFYRAANSRISEDLEKYGKEYGKLRYQMGEELAKIRIEKPLAAKRSLESIVRGLIALKKEIKQTNDHINGDIESMKKGNHINNAKEITEKLADFNKKFGSIDKDLNTLNEKIKNIQVADEDIAKEKSASASKIQKAFRAHTAKKKATAIVSPPAEPQKEDSTTQLDAEHRAELERHNAAIAELEKKRALAAPK